VINKGRVVGREDVLARWRSDDGHTPGADPDNNALEVYIHRLRKKLEGSRLSIRNVRGLGYLLDSV
jgi:DNA-binding response OmpR family regulator